ncbi:MAG: CBS domain-containing protein, partial [Cyclobacteriaceae bacterium]
SIKMPRVKATEIAGGIGQMMAIFFVFFGLFNNPILVLIGIFIFLGAQAEVNHTKQNFFLKGFQVSDALMRKFPIVAFDAPLQTAVDKLLDSQATHFVVVKEDEPIATLSREEIIIGLKEGKDQISIQDAADPKPLRIDIDMPLEDALKKMASENKKVALVYEGHHFLGILDQENIIEFIMVKSALTK